MENVLTVHNLNVCFEQWGGVAQAVRGVCLEVRRGEILALVGESGCGKTVTAQSILRLNDAPGVRVEAEKLFLGDFDVQNASEKEMERVRGSLAGMVFQDPLTCLNPTMKIGKQVTERMYRSGEITAAKRGEEAVRLLKMVGIPEPELRAQQYPHQFSGGMRQRIMIAMALAGKPGLLIADEPTTALDVTIQLQILKLIYGVCRESGTSVLLITHDFGVVANLADRVAVMYAGRIVEEGGAEELFRRPSHPYTKGLLESLPLPGSRGRLANIPGSPPLSCAGVGCAFAPRCVECMRICLREEPPAAELTAGHTVSCWRFHDACPKGGKDDR